MDDREALARVLDPDAMDHPGLTPKVPYWWNRVERARAQADAILASDWLTAVKAEAWDEGDQAGTVEGDQFVPPTNPYRATSASSSTTEGTES